MSDVKLPAATATAGPEVLRVLAGRYQLEAELGRGGMAVVHRARDLVLGREVALKLLLDPNGKDRFLSEARKTAQIRHPNVVTVYETGQDGGDTFLSMELLAGETLEQRLCRDELLTPRTAARIAAAICGGLGAAHALGMVHRDIKPSNVFLTEGSGDADSTTKVIDFGIAKRVDGATIETDPGMLVGTFAYMSPEQIKGGALDGRADLYAVGVMLFRMLAGRLPFDQQTAASLIHAHLTAPPPELPNARHSAEHARLGAVIKQLLAKSVADRPRDAAAARAAILSAAGEEAAPAAAPVELELELPSAPARSEPPEAEPAPLALELDVERGAPRSAHASAPSAPPLPYAPPPFGAPRPANGHGGYGGPLVPNVPPPELELPPARATGLLQSIPTGVSKRIAGYSLLALLISAVFFRVSSTFLAALGALALFGFAAYVARKKR